MKKILFLIILVFTLNCQVNALSYGGCDYSAISRLKSLVTNVNLSYDYHMEDNNPYFDLTITNITTDMYFYDSVTRRNYTYYDTQNGQITIYNYNVNSGVLQFYTNIGECPGIKLGTKYYKFPKYNYYHSSDLCVDIQNYSLCQKWADVNYSYEEMEELIFNYKNQEIEEETVQIQYNKSLFDKILEFYIDYYYILLGSIILVLGTIIFVKSRNNKFDL